MVNSMKPAEMYSENHARSNTEFSHLSHQINPSNIQPQSQEGTSGAAPAHQGVLSQANMMTKGVYAASAYQLYEVKQRDALYNESAKPGPSYADSDDVQYNYPAMPPVGRQNFSTLTEQDPLDFDDFNYPFNDDQPAMERQDSLNTLMEVIADHDINDITPYRKMHSDRSPPTQPINIQKQSGNAAMAFGSQVTVKDLPTISPGQYTVLAAPASDMRRYRQSWASSTHSSVSISPATGMSVYRYQEDFPIDGQAMSSYEGGTPPVFITNEANYSQRAHAVVAYQATEDLRSPFQIPVSPLTINLSQQCNIRSPTAVQQAAYAGCSGNAFTFDETPFNPSQSCPDFMGNGYGAAAMTSHHSVVNQLGVASTSSSRSLTLTEPGSPLAFRLEEVDPSTVKEVPDLSELGRAEIRRIRNNLACRASRQRRKRRKAETESRADQLEDENKQLKQQILQLEEDVKSCTANVRQRMGHP